MRVLSLEQPMWLGGNVDIWLESRFNEDRLVQFIKSGKTNRELWDKTRFPILFRYIEGGSIKFWELVICKVDNWVLNNRKSVSVMGLKKVQESKIRPEEDGLGRNQVSNLGMWELINCKEYKWSNSRKWGKRYDWLPNKIRPPRVEKRHEGKYTSSHLQSKFAKVHKVEGRVTGYNDLISIFKRLVQLPKVSGKGPNNPAMVRVNKPVNCPISSGILTFGKVLSYNL